MGLVGSRDLSGSQGRYRGRRLAVKHLKVQGSSPGQKETPESGWSSEAAQGSREVRVISGDEGGRAKKTEKERPGRQQKPQEHSRQSSKEGTVDHRSCCLSRGQARKGP